MTVAVAITAAVAGACIGAFVALTVQQKLESLYRSFLLWCGYRIVELTLPGTDDPPHVGVYMVGGVPCFWVSTYHDASGNLRVVIKYRVESQ